AEAAEMVDLPDFSNINPGNALSDPAPAEPETSGAVLPEISPEKPKPVYVDPYAKALRGMDFTALREANPDVLGWILIPNTPVSYPLVQGADNQYYLKRNWKTWTSVVGSIFMECKNSSDFSDFNTIIYGHRMNNGSMFAFLKHYKQQSTYDAHPAIYITDDAGSRKYEIFAAYEVSTKSSTYLLGFADNTAKQNFLDDCVGRSVIKTQVVPTVNDQILTLSTCTGNGHATRWVVQARLKGETPPEAPAKIQANPTPATPPANPAPKQTPPAPANPPANSTVNPPAALPVNPPADSAVNSTANSPAALPANSTEVNSTEKTPPPAIASATPKAS
ncbi:MAG: class B sortase, partial [Oscillibacter sp.]